MISLQLAKKADLGLLAFGTIDSWLIWKLTKGILVTLNVQCPAYAPSCLVVHVHVPTLCLPT